MILGVFGHFQLFSVIFVIHLLLVLFLRTLQNALKEVKVANRAMNPYHVWFILIPFFGAIWQFIVVIRIADSLKNEFIDRNIFLEEKRPGFVIGLAYSGLTFFGWVPLFWYFHLLAGLICWVIYWINIYSFAQKLRETKINYHAISNR